jgi:dTDP-4-dehydrorhamnose reductase
VILVFGGNGQLGRELARMARERRIPFCALPRAQADISDAQAVAEAFAAHSPTVVVNAAAYTKVDLAEREPEAAMLGNAKGPQVLAQACARSGIPLVHVSTDYVFDGAKTAPYVEDDPIAPISAYGRSKAAGEAAVRATAPCHLILRTAWVYSEFGSNFLKTMLRLARERDELRVVADQHGSPTSTRDLANAILTAAPRLLNDPDLAGTYHFTGAGITSWHGFGERIVAAQAPFTGRNPKVVPISTEEFPAPARRPKNSALDCTHFTRSFGVAPRPWQDETDAVVRALVTENEGASRVA